MTERITKEQAVIMSAYTGYLCGPVFSEMHGYIEKILERPVFTHELADRDVQKEIKEKSLNDFLGVCYDTN